ncbi:MAG TPA: helix-turn-helix domain-containing protein [Phycisphaerae bacterium]|nr:helix-turn-helix domain-containing protein [Phycisphaerae bacterium]
MKFIDKLLRLQAERGYAWAKIERNAGLSRNRISNMINQGTMPAADDGIKLARALGVSAEWLFDEDQGWPPPDNSARRLTPEEVKARVVQILELLRE